MAVQAQAGFTDPTAYKDIILNPIFEPIKSLLEFYILAVGFVGIPSFQTAFLTNHPELGPFIIL